MDGCCLFSSYLMAFAGFLALLAHGASAARVVAALGHAFCWC